MVILVSAMPNFLLTSKDEYGQGRVSKAGRGDEPSTFFIIITILIKCIPILMNKKAEVTLPFPFPHSPYNHNNLERGISTNDGKCSWPHH